MRDESLASFIRSASVQWRVISALVLREAISRFGRKNIGVLWLLAEPMFFTLGIVALWSFAGPGHGDIPVAAFAVTGYQSVLLWRNVVNRCNSAIQGNMGLLFHRNVTVFDVMVARIVLEIVGTTASFIMLIGLGLLFDLLDLPEDIGTLVVGWIALAWFGAALGLLIGAATAYSELVERFWHPIAYLLFPISGAAFLVDWLSPAMQEIVLLLPMVHGVELIRSGYFGASINSHYDLAYMCFFNLVLSLLGLLILSQAKRKVESL